MSPLRARTYEDDERIGVLYLAPWVDLGGSDKGTIDWFRTIDRSRYRPYLITTQPSPNRWLHLVEPHAEEIWDLPDLMEGGSMPRFILGFIASRRVQVVHIMNSRLAFDLLLDMSLLPEPPVTVVQLHAEEPDRAGYVRYVSTRYGNLVDCFSVTSEQLATAMGDYDVPRSKLAIITTGVDAEREFSPDHAEPLAGVGQDAPAVLWPGRLTDQKDPLLSLDVVRAVKDAGRRFELCVVGDGYMEGAVRARVAELGIEDMVFFYPPARLLADWYRSSYALLMTSVFEGIPYVMFEAMAMGVPVIVPALPGNRELVSDDVGYLVDPRDDVDGYARALIELLDDPGGRDAMGARAREAMLADHSLPHMGRAHDELYTRLIEHRAQQAKVRGPASSEVHADRDAVSEAPRFHRTTPSERSVGVIVPCYEHGRFLGDCLDSIRRQTLPAAQIVVVDDGSNDRETVDALAQAERDAQVTVVRLERNLGPSAARNAGLDRLDTTYVLPVDADDMLCDDALEQMVAQIERAPDDVGFIYPNPQHFGNRNDYVVVPDWNLSILLEENVCAATSLFDRRVFDAGVRYPEDVVLGHEDWDLILQLADRGVRGQPARGKTFLYRKRGFSRVDAVGVGPTDFADEIAERHPALYENADRIKSRWAPALSVIGLLEGAERTAVAEGLARQTCVDFELLAADGDAGVADAERLARDLQRARGRYVMLAGPGSAVLFADPAAIEKLIRVLIAHRDLPGIAFTAAGSDAAGTSRFQQLTRLPDGAGPLAVAWSRDPSYERSRPVRLSEDAPVMEAVTMALETDAPIQWRAVGSVVG